MKTTLRHMCGRSRQMILDKGGPRHRFYKPPSLLINMVYIWFDFDLKLFPYSQKTGHIKHISIVIETSRVWCKTLPCAACSICGMLWFLTSLPQMRFYLHPTRPNFRMIIQSLWYKNVLHSTRWTGSPNLYYKPSLSWITDLGEALSIFLMLISIDRFYCPWACSCFMNGYLLYDMDGAWSNTGGKPYVRRPSYIKFIWPLEEISGTNRAATEIPELRQGASHLIQNCSLIGQF